MAPENRHLLESLNEVNWETAQNLTINWEMGNFVSDNWELKIYCVSWQIEFLAWNYSGVLQCGNFKILLRILIN